MREGVTFDEAMGTFEPLARRYVAVKGDLPFGPQCLMLLGDGSVRFFPQLSQVQRDAEKGTGKLAQHLQGRVREEGVVAVAVLGRASAVDLDEIPDELRPVLENHSSAEGRDARRLAAWMESRGVGLGIHLVTPAGCRAYLMSYHQDELGSTLGAPEPAGDTEPLSALPLWLQFWHDERVLS
jgi:hypothetical protein